MKQLSLLFLLIFANLAFASCEEIIASLTKRVPTLRVEFQRGVKQKLDSIHSLKGLEELYFLIKHEQINYLDHYLNKSKNLQTLTQKDIDTIKQQKKLNLEDPEDYMIFYTNSLKSFLFEIVDKSNQLYVEQLFPHLKSAKIKKTLIHIVDYFRSKKPDPVTNYDLEYLRENSPLSVSGLPKRDTLDAFIIYLEKNPKISEETLDEDSFKELLETTNLGNDDYSLKKILLGEKLKQNCCVSQGGCLFCPNNRGLLNKSRELKKAAENS